MRGPMITVTITEGGQFLDEIEFDDADVIACHGALTVIHRDVMQEGSGGGLWHRVAHAAGIVAERGRLLDTLQANERRQADINAALSILAKAPDIPPHPRDEISQDPAAGRAGSEEDLSH